MSKPCAPVDAPYPGMTGLSRLRSLISRSSCPPRPADEFLLTWHTASGSKLRFQEWCDPATQYVAMVVRTVSPVQRGMATSEVDRAVIQFAQARAGADYSAAEVAADVVALFQVVTPGRPALRTAPIPQEAIGVVARALTAWATTHVEAAAVSSCTDPVTGLVTGGFLRGRLRELHAQCDALVISPSSTFGCLVLQVVVSDPVAPARMAARITVGRVLNHLFTSGETVAALGPERFVVVSPAYALDDSEGAVREALSSEMEPGVVATVTRQSFADNPEATWQSLAGTGEGP